MIHKVTAVFIVIRFFIAVVVDVAHLFLRRKILRFFSGFIFTPKQTIQKYHVFIWFFVLNFLCWAAQLRERALSKLPDRSESFFEDTIVARTCLGATGV